MCHRDPDATHPKMDAEAALDLCVALYAVLAVGFMVALIVLFAVRRRDPLLRANNPPMLILMAAGAVFHILSEVVGNRHAAFLSAIEMAACPLWGYWVPYVLGAGPFFTGLYLRLFTYTTAVSREFNTYSAARARRWRWPVALVTVFPVACIAGLVTVTEGATRADEDLGTCVSERGFKIAVGAWMSACILALLVSVAFFRHGLVADFGGEIHKQAFVGVMGMVVLTAVAFVMLFAEEGLDNVANRFVATFSITTLYMWALGVLGAWPLWKTFRKKSGYLKVLDQQMEAVTQPIDSVMSVLEHAEDRGAARILFADFIAYCSLGSRPHMDRGKGAVTPPQAIATFYAQMDYWTNSKLAELGVTHRIDDPDMRKWPPLVATDIKRTHREIIERYFSRNAAPGFIDIGISDKVRDNTTRKNVAENTPDDLFAEAMWWAVGLLDEYYGENYLIRDVCARDVFTSAQNPSVRLMIQQMRRTEARRRMAEANLTSPEAEYADDGGALVAVVVGDEDVGVVSVDPHDNGGDIEMATDEDSSQDGN